MCNNFYYGSKAAAVGRNKEHGWDRVTKHEDDLEEDRLLVGVGARLLGHIHRGAGANLTVAVESCNRGPDDPADAGCQDNRIYDTVEDGELLILGELVRHLSEAIEKADDGDDEAAPDDAGEFLSHVLTDFKVIWLLGLGGEAVPIRLVSSVVFVGVIRDQGLNTKLNDKARPGHIFFVELLNGRHDNVCTQ